jgi:hypothetical protein
VALAPGSIDRTDCCRRFVCFVSMTREDHLRHEHIILSPKGERLGELVISKHLNLLHMPVETKDRTGYL